MPVCAAVLCNGHRVVDSSTGELIPFRVILIQMEQLTFEPEQVYNDLIALGFEAKIRFNEDLLEEAPKGFK